MNGYPQMFNLNPLEFTSAVGDGHQLGMVGMDKYGDLYRYSQIGASNAVAGQIQGAPVQKTNHHNRTVVAAAVGSRKVTVNLGATAAVAQEYAGGYLVVNDATGEGVSYRISGNKAGDSSGTCEVTLEKPLVEALVASDSEVTLVHNAWNGVIVGTAVTVRAAGVPLVDATAAYYGWLKTRGVAAVLIGTAATLGADLIIGGTAGSVTDRTDALGASAEPVVAVADIVLGVAGEYNPVRLCID